MSNKNERIIKLISENFQDFQEESRTLYNLDQNIQNKLKIISQKLMPFIQKNCVEEFRDLVKKYNIVDSSETGIQFKAKSEEDKTLVNKVERCIDRHFGLNKALAFYDIDTRNLTLEDDRCKRACIAEADKIEDKALVDCLRICYQNYYTEFIQLASNFESELNKINLKI